MTFAEKIKAAPAGQTHVFSVGQAGFIIKNSDGKLLGIDLCLSDYVEKLEGHVGFKRLLPKIFEPGELVLDVLVATHCHGDHYDYDAMPGLMDNDTTYLFAACDCMEMVREQKIEAQRVQFVKPGDTFRCAGFEISFVNCDHGKGAPLAVGVLVETDGKRILEVGDTCLRTEFIPEYLQKGKLQVLIAPINGMYGNLNEEECAKLGDMLQPDILIPCHYGMYASHMGSLGKFYEIMTNRYAQNHFLLMTQGERYTIENEKEG